MKKKKNAGIHTPQHIIEHITNQGNKQTPIQIKHVTQQHHIEHNNDVTKQMHATHNKCKQ